MSRATSTAIDNATTQENIEQYDEMHVFEGSKPKKHSKPDIVLKFSANEKQKDQQQKSDRSHDRREKLLGNIPVTILKDPMIASVKEDALSNFDKYLKLNSNEVTPKTNTNQFKGFSERVERYLRMTWSLWTRNTNHSLQKE